MQIIDRLSDMVSVCDVGQLSEKTVLHSSFLERLGGSGRNAYHRLFQYRRSGRRGGAG